MPKFEEIYNGPSKESLEKPFLQEDLEIMGYSFDSEGEVILNEKGEPILEETKKYFDPINKKDYPQREIPRYKTKKSENMAETLEEEESLKEFEEINIVEEIKSKIKEELDEEFKREVNKRPEFSKEEEVFMEAFFNKWFKRHLSKEKFLTGERELEMISEFKEALPVKYAQIVNRRVLPEKIEWTKEPFRDKQGKLKEGIVSYYPNKNNSVIKYVLKTEGKPQISDSKKFFAAHFIADKKNRVVIFCEELKKRPSNAKMGFRRKFETSK